MVNEIVSHLQKRHKVPREYLTSIQSQNGLRNSVSHQQRKEGAPRMFHIHKKTRRLPKGLTSIKRQKGPPRLFHIHIEEKMGCRYPIYQKKSEGIPKNISHLWNDRKASRDCFTSTKRQKWFEIPRVYHINKNRKEHQDSLITMKNI